MLPTNNKELDAVAKGKKKYLPVDKIIITELQETETNVGSNSEANNLPGKMNALS